MERPDLAAELERLAGNDLTVRSQLADRGELSGGYHPEMRVVHRRNGDRLTAILDEVGGWPGDRLVGEGGSWAAYLIAQHDIANPDLLRRSRDLYAAAVERADADPVHLANLEDRIRYFEGRPQRYGTHFGWNEDGAFGPWPPLDEPELVDQHRAQLGLPPLAEAVEAAGEGCPAHRPADEVIEEHRAAEAFARAAGWRSTGH